ncbi:cytochrome P450 [Amanita rubescens]|nr:cytochrome P450 [Amanita rubescens]
MGTQLLSLIALLTFIYYAPAIYKRIINNIKLRSFPTVGNSDPFTSYIGALRFQKYAKEMVEEGYHKYRGAIFKVPMLFDWAIMISGPDKIEDFRRAPDDVAHVDPSYSRRSIQGFIHVIRTPLTRNVGVRYPDVLDEIITAFNDHIPIKNEEWIKITIYPTIADIVCRTSNRMLVGLPLCRDPDYLELNKQFTVDVIKSTRILRLFPHLLKPIVARFLNSAKGLKRGLRHIGPLVKEREGLETRYGKDWQDRPVRRIFFSPMTPSLRSFREQNDILTWLVEISKGQEPWTAREITSCILLINFAAIRTTTLARKQTAVTHSIYDLAAHPEYLQPLRQEIKAAVEEEGWSKAAVAKMTKLDSFIKETMRIAPIGAFMMQHRTTKDFTFSDGTTIPAGNFIGVPTSCIHTDPDNYADAERFDGFRFEKMREKEGDSSKHSLVSLDLDYLLFGHGRHACPGRSFAANVVKTMLAHVVLNYDVKMADGGGRPENVWFGQFSFPNPKAQLVTLVTVKKSGKLAYAEAEGPVYAGKLDVITAKRVSAGNQVATIWHAKAHYIEETTHVLATATVHKNAKNGGEQVWQTWVTRALNAEAMLSAREVKQALHLKQDLEREAILERLVHILLAIVTALILPG